MSDLPWIKHKAGDDCPTHSHAFVVIRCGDNIMGPMSASLAPWLVDATSGYFVTEYFQCLKDGTPTPPAVEKGQKHDAGKPRYDLIPAHAEAEMVDVLTFGAGKYGAENWRKVQRERYIAAAGRHRAAYRMGETNDPETGKHHLAHAMCCDAFVIELDLQEQEK